MLCIQTLAFYMYVKGIKRIISLQGCPNTYHDPVRGDVLPDNCEGSIPGSPLDNNYEKNVWMGLKRMTSVTENDPNITFINDCQIPDFQAGSLITWTTLGNFNYNDPNQKTLIHCLAGFGRTGSALLMIMFKYMMMINPANIACLQQDYCGYPNRRQMFTGIRDIFAGYLQTNNEAENGATNAVITGFNTASIVREVFDVNNLNHVNLLITRINYCVYISALDGGLEGQQIVLYRKHNAMPAPNAPIFIPANVVISQLNVSTIALDPNNNYGFKVF
jgi:hypothetical protein